VFPGVLSPSLVLVELYCKYKQITEDERRISVNFQPSNGINVLTAAASTGPMYSAFTKPVDTKPTS
jgi:hypothetical protein